jgi:hypothetical protein
MSLVDTGGQIIWTRSLHPDTHPDRAAAGGSTVLVSWAEAMRRRAAAA